MHHTDALVGPGCIHHHHSTVTGTVVERERQVLRA